MALIRNRINFVQRPPSAAAPLISGAIPVGASMPMATLPPLPPDRRVNRNKIEGYLLHPVNGRGRAAFFEAYAFSLAWWVEINRRLARACCLRQGEPNPGVSGSLLALRPQPLGGVERRDHDVLVTGAAAQIARNPRSGPPLRSGPDCRATIPAALSACRACRSRIASRDCRGRLAAADAAGRGLVRCLRRSVSRGHRPARRASGRSAPSGRPAGPCRRRTRRARSRDACPVRPS